MNTPVAYVLVHSSDNSTESRVKMLLRIVQSSWRAQTPMYEKEKRVYEAGVGMAKLVPQPRVRGQRDHFMLRLLQKASQRTAASDRNPAQVILSVKSMLLAHKIGKSTSISGVSWVQRSWGVMEHHYVHVTVCVSVCLCVGVWCVCLSYLLVGLLTVWIAFLGKFPLYGSCL